VESASGWDWDPMLAMLLTSGGQLHTHTHTLRLLKNSRPVSLDGIKHRQIIVVYAK
jgi:hypothetical protein